YIGIPCVHGLGLFCRRRAQPSKVDAIGLLKTAGIGDTVLLGGVIKDLREVYPKASILLFTGMNNYQAAFLNADLDKVIGLPIWNLPASFRLVRQFNF